MGGRCGRSRGLVKGVISVPVILRVGAVNFGDELADEGPLVEGREVGAEEVVARAVETVVVNLERMKRLF